MKIKLLKSMAIDGKHCKTEQVVDVSDLDGNYLVSRGHAEKVEETKGKSEPQKGKEK